MQHALGYIILLIAAAIVVWGARNLYWPKKRQKGMRFKLPPQNEGDA